MALYDVVIGGGGPAGSTVASLVKKYAPHLHVLVLEKMRFPRHHIGESMLAGTTPILKEMDAYDKISRHGFLEKLGATFVWGQNRQPWGFDFEQITSHLAAQGRTLPETYTKAWQVRRHEYDHILLDHAAEMGAEVRQGARIHEPIIDRATGRVVGVEFSDDSGRQTVECALFVDCTGQDALLGHAFNLREYDEAMNNYALYGYWKGGRWKHEYTGHPNLTRIFIATTPRGWIWYIPLYADTISVGFVTHRRILKENAGSTESLYQEELRDCPEISGLLDGAHLVRITPDQKRDVMSIQDWSYRSQRMAGPGWAMCGDAAGFVDPILSTGAMLAHELGQKAAYTINSAFSANSDAQVAAYWDFYQDTYRSYLKAYRDMASFWYTNNFSMESWWWQARRTIADAQEQVDLNDPESFNRVAAGYANRTESLSLFGSYPLHEAAKLVDGIFGKTSAENAALEQQYHERTLRLNPAARLSAGMYYFQGSVRSTQRVVIPGKKHYLDLHPGEDLLVQLINGQHTLSDLNQAAESIRCAKERLPVRTGTELLIQLDNIGALV